MESHGTFSCTANTLCCGASPHKPSVASTMSPRTTAAVSQSRPPSTHARRATASSFCRRLTLCAMTTRSAASEMVDLACPCREMNAASSRVASSYLAAAAQQLILSCSSS